MNRIYLIGYMGSGKSSVGQLLANELNWGFCDLDDLIEKRSGQSIVDLFEHFGQAEFRNVEASAVHQTTRMDLQIVATGGGAPCYFDNLGIMKNAGTVIYFKGSVDVLAKRITMDKHNIRPLVNSKTSQELEDFIEQHLTQRSSFYERAHYYVDIDQSKKEIVAKILELTNVNKV